MDSHRDIEIEVATAIRFFPYVLSQRTSSFPDVLSRRTRPEEERDEYYYPIQCQVLITNGADIGCSSKAVSFLPLLVKLVIEFGSFAVEDRG